MIVLMLFHGMIVLMLFHVITLAYAACRGVLAHWRPYAGGQTTLGTGGPNANGTRLPILAGGTLPMAVSLY